MALHKAHQAVLDCIQAHWRSHEISPTVQEIESEMGRSRGSIQNSLKRLKDEGYITWVKYKSRTIRLLKPDPTLLAPSAALEPVPSSSQGLPILGEIAAGCFHDPFTEEVGELLDMSYPNRNPDDYVLRISGDSMVGAGIPDGAYVGIRPVLKDYKPRSGEIVAVWVNGQGATLKHYRQQDSIVVLEAANPKYEPIILDLKTTEITIEGTHIFTYWQTAAMG